MLVLEKGLIPPLANFETVNPKIDTDFWNLKFPMELTPWPTKGLRRASVNSFGFGGSNAHCIMDDAYNFLHLRNLKANHSTLEQPSLPMNYSPKERASNAPITENGDFGQPTNGYLVHKNQHPSLNGNGVPVQLNHENMEAVPFKEHLSSHTKEGILVTKLLVWSAADENGLDRLAEVYSTYFQGLNLDVINEKIYLRNLAYTLASRRSALPWKSFMLAESLSGLQEPKLLFSSPVRSSKNPAVAFIFTGQGAQYSQMGLELLCYPVFRGVLQSIDAIIHGMGCTWSLIGEFYCTYFVFLSLSLLTRTR